MGLVSVAARNGFPTQSVPALVERAYWNGAHSCSNVLANCLARVLATKRLSELPVAVPLTPPSGFAKRCESSAHQRIHVISGGILARAKTRDCFEEQCHNLHVVQQEF